MAGYTLRPPPSGGSIDSPEWKKWLFLLQENLRTLLPISFATLDFTGSNLTSLETRNHNDLQNFQGGTTNQYYHLTATQHTDLTDGGDSTLHYHASDRDLANATGNLAVTNLNGGTNASATTFWRGDGTWALTESGIIYNVISSPLTIAEDTSYPVIQYLDVQSDLTVEGNLLVFDGGSGTGGTGTPVEVLDEGVSLTTNLASLNFTGSGVTATALGDAITIDIPGGGGGGSGTVTSVGVSVPTGFTVSNSPVTTSGTITISYTAGYSLPTNAKQTNWDTAFTDRLKWDGGATGLTASTGRTSLGATTVGSNLFTVTDPNAITFIRVNADNTISLLDAATFRTAIGAGSGGGGSVEILDEGVSLTANVASINFVGDAVTATTSGDDVTVTITGSSVSTGQIVALLNSTPFV